MQVEFPTIETVSWIGAHFMRDDHDMLGSWFHGPAFDPDGYSFAVLNSTSPGNFWMIDDPEVDRLTQAQRVELDLATRHDLLREIPLLDMNNAFRVWTVNAYQIQLRKPNDFNGVDTIHAWGNIGWGAKGDEKIGTVPA